MTRRSLARLKLIGVLLIFLGPLALAYLLYYGLSYGGAQTNNGTLVSPAQPLPPLTLTDARGQSLSSATVFGRKWTILQVAAGACASTCRQSLDETRQIRLLLHRRASRVQRVLLVDRGRARPSIARQPDLRIYGVDAAVLDRVFEQENAAAPGTVYLVDPLGNWVLYYPASGDGDGLFKDIKHLLKLSHIG